ncbi:MAG: homoserine dehydrogenase [Alphaproteobacteria bacterium]|nr:homoserine dehydrogenase [Alphaproteobacteria bacterium]
MSPKLTRIVIAGVGTVGNGVLDLLAKNKILQNFRFEIPYVASRRKINIRKFHLKNTKVFRDAKSILELNDYDVLVELIGGDEGVSKKIVFDALKKGKKVVTANKALVSKYWDEINKRCTKYNSLIFYEAAVAGGIPIIKVIKEFLLSDKIRKIYGILNGTSNFILTNMLTKNEDFEKILKKAQELGYAEAEPSFDIDGIDTAHKLSILASIAFNLNCSVDKVSTDGIRNIELMDLKYSEELGYKIKLLGIINFKNKELLSFVYPCLIDKRELISSVDGVYNGIVVESDFCKKSFFQGERAGAEPTATSVVSDLLTIKNSSKKNKTIINSNIKHKSLKIDNRIGSYYLRFTTIDKSGVISGITKEFKKNNISMKSMLQKDQNPNSKNATIVVTTHNCLEKDIKKALTKINALKFIIKKTVMIRIENFK